MKLHEITDNHRDAIFEFIQDTYIERATIRDSGVVDVKGGVFINELGLRDIPIKFGIVEGAFECSNNYLDKIREWAPESCFNFTASGNCLVDADLKYIPNCKNLDISRNLLKSLNNLPDFEYCTIDATANEITSLVGISDVISRMKRTHTFTKCVFNITFKNIKEGGLGLVLIPGLEQLGSRASNHFMPKPFQIIEKYLGKGEDGLIECQSELIEAGFEDFAVL